MTADSAHDYALVLERTFDAPPALVFKAWTDPQILPRWWAPRPFTTVDCRIDLRVGGEFSTLMRGPDGTDYPNAGVLLEIIPDHKLVFTDAFAPGWRPAGKPFMTGELVLHDLGGKTHYVATARHWSAEDMQAHEKMGFREGWGQCADQLAELLPTL